MMSNITSNTPRAAPEAPSIPSQPSGHRRAPGGGFWSFLKTLFVGTAGLAVLGVVGALAGSAWLTANQRAEAEKPQPWVDPSFTTTAVTTGGMLARWIDNDGNLDNGHTYIQGIYNLWKARTPPDKWSSYALDETTSLTLPPLWRIEFTRDVAAARDAAKTAVEKSKAETNKRYHDGITDLYKNYKY